MAIQTSDFSALTVDLQSIFNESASQAIADMTGNSIFEVMDTDRRTYIHLILHGLDVIRSVAQGSDLPATSTVQGDSITYTQNRYGGIVSVTKDMRLFDLYDQIQSITRSAADDAFHKIDQSMADVLTNGFSSSNYTDVYGDSVGATGPDGNTFSNIIVYNGVTNPLLTRESVIAGKIAAMNYRDPVGKNRPTKLDTLVVSPANWDLAMRIIDSDRIQGSMDNDTNGLVRGMKLKVWEKLTTRTGGTDTSAYFFMVDSSRVGESLMALFRERPTLDAPEQVYKNKNWDYSIDYYYALGRGFPQYVYGSNATLS